MAVFDFEVTQKENGHGYLPHHKGTKEETTKVTKETKEVKVIKPKATKVERKEAKVKTESHQNKKTKMEVQREKKEKEKETANKRTGNEICVKTTMMVNRGPTQRDHRTSQTRATTKRYQ